MLRTGQWYYCNKNTEWERYQVRDYVVPKFYSITWIDLTHGEFLPCSRKHFLRNDTVALEWESIFITIRYDKINPELQTVFSSATCRLSVERIWKDHFKGNTSRKLRRKARYFCGCSAQVWKQCAKWWRQTNCQGCFLLSFEIVFPSSFRWARDLRFVHKNNDQQQKLLGITNLLPTAVWGLLTFLW